MQYLPTFIQVLICDWIYKNHPYPHILYCKLQLLGACAYNFRRSVLKFLPCLLSIRAYDAICHLLSSHI